MCCHGRREDGDGLFLDEIDSKYVEVEEKKKDRPLQPKCLRLSSIILSQISSSTMTEPIDVNNYNVQTKEKVKKEVERFMAFRLFACSFCCFVESFFPGPRKLFCEAQRVIYRVYFLYSVSNSTFNYHITPLAALEAFSFRFQDDHIGFLPRIKSDC